MTSEISIDDPNSPFVSVRLKEFRLYIIQPFFFVMAMRMILRVVGWKMYLLTNALLLFSITGLEEEIPAVSLSLYSGHVVDKSDKRTLLLKTIILYLVCAGGLLFITL